MSNGDRWPAQLVLTRERAASRLQLWQLATGIPNLGACRLEVLDAESVEFTTFRHFAKICSREWTASTRG